MATTIDFEEALAAAGGAEQIHTALVDSSRRARLLDAKMADLIQQRPHEWVAMPEGDALVFAKSLDGLLSKMRAEGIPTNTAVIKFLDPNPKTLIL